MNRISIGIKRTLILIVSFLMVFTAAGMYSPVNAATAKPTKMYLSVSNYTVDIHGKATIRVKSVKPTKASRAVAYKSSNRRIAVVSSKGVVTGKKAGKVRITVASKANKKLKKTVTITVRNIKASRVRVTCKTKELKVGETVKAAYSITAAKGYYNQGVTWSSSDKSVAVVSGGTIKAVAPGTAVIRAKAKDGSGKYGTVTVCVTAAETPVKAETFGNVSDKRLAEIAAGDFKDVKLGTAGWAVGDTRKITAGDREVTMRILDISHAATYGEDVHAVIGIDETIGDECSYNLLDREGTWDYLNRNYQGSVLQEKCGDIFNSLSPEMQSVILEATYPTAFVELNEDDYEDVYSAAGIKARLIAPAEKELYGAVIGGTECEAEQLSQLDYYAEKVSPEDTSVLAKGAAYWTRSLSEQFIGGGNACAVMADGTTTDYTPMQDNEEWSDYPDDMYPIYVSVIGCM